MFLETAIQKVLQDDQGVEMEDVLLLTKSKVMTVEAIHNESGYSPAPARRLPKLLCYVLNHFRIIFFRIISYTIGTM